MKATRGDVWWGPAPHKSDPAYRPWLVVSDDAHPFASEECIRRRNDDTRACRRDRGLERGVDSWRVGKGSVRLSVVRLLTIESRRYPAIHQSQNKRSRGLQVDALFAFHNVWRI
jgi:hypothetical protein